MSAPARSGGASPRRTRSARVQAARLVSRLRRGERGEELVEFVLTLPVLLLLVFGILELGNLLERQHAISGLGREAANLASRGTSLDSVIQITLSNGVPVQLGAAGGTVASRVQMQGGSPVLSEQSASSGYGGRSRLGQPGDTVSALSGIGLIDGQSYYVVELFLSYRSFTPFSRLVGGIVPDTLYDQSIF